MVLKYRGHFFWRAYWKQLCAKPEMDCGESGHRMAPGLRTARPPVGPGPESLLPPGREPLLFWLPPDSWELRPPTPTSLWTVLPTSQFLDLIAGADLAKPPTAWASSRAPDLSSQSPLSRANQRLARRRSSDPITANTRSRPFLRSPQKVSSEDSWSPPSLPGVRRRPRRLRRDGDGRGLTSSVLYMPMPTPPAGKLYTSHSLPPLPSFGVKTILNVPARSTTKSVALYCREERQFRPGLPRGARESTHCVSTPGLPGHHGHACQ